MKRKPEGRKRVRGNEELTEAYTERKREKMRRKFLFCFCDQGAKNDWNDYNFQMN